MTWVKNKYGKYFSEKKLLNLFILWLLLFPFDANLLPISIGFMTLYPVLILTGAILIYTLIAPSKLPFKKNEKWICSFFFFWLLYGIVLAAFSNGKSLAFYEIKALFLMAATVLMMYRVKAILKEELFFSTINKISGIVFVFFIAIAFFEFFSGIHFEGKFTEKILKAPPGMVTYSPVFFYDNPNSFLVYLFGTSVIYILTDLSIIKHPSKFLLIVFTLLFFSIVADSKFGKIASFILSFVFLYNFFANNFAVYKKQIALFFIPLLLLIPCIMLKPIFLGPYWKNTESYAINYVDPVSIKNNQLYFYSTDSLVKQFGEKEVIRAYQEYQVRGTDWAVNIRKNLILNGLFLLKKSNYLGVGPGQFIWYSQQKKMPYFTGTITSPHDSSTEIYSQYGLLVFLPFVVLLIYSWRNVLKFRNNNYTHFIAISSCFILYYIISDMPSAWLNLNINWILTSILFMICFRDEYNNNLNTYNT